MGLQGKDKVQKWLLRDNTIKHLCTSCSRKNMEDLVMLEPWKESDQQKKIKCDKCGKEQPVRITK